MMLGWREILLILIIALALFYSRSFRVVGLKKSLGMEPITPEDEIKIGKSWLADVAEKQNIEPERDARITRILADFNQSGQLTFTKYRVFRLHTSEINAVALPGAHLLITRGLMDLPDVSDEELAGILAHEIGHVELGHCRKAVIQKNRNKALRTLLSLVSRGPAKGVLILEQLAKLGISRESELEADDFAVQLLSKSHYPPLGLVQFLERAEKMNDVPEWLIFFSTHPATDERIQRLRQKLGSS